MLSHLRRYRLVAAIFLALPIACGDGDDGSPTEPDGSDGTEPQVSSVSVSPSRAELAEIGETRVFEATARDASGDEIPGVSYTWISSASSVATVGTDGTVTAQANGATTIEANAEGVTGAAKLTVRAGELAWTWIGAGLINSCGVTTHGTLYCWGENDHAAFGEGAAGIVSSSTPVALESDLYFVRVRMGGGHICARTYGSEPYCWGASGFGERGNGVISNEQSTPVRVHNLDSVAQLAASGNHTCAITHEQTAYCWGRNAQGQLGDGTTTDRTRPVAVEGSLTFRNLDANLASVLGNHTCGVTTEGDAYCWGPNESGELGDGTTSARSSPTLVQGDLDLEQIAAGAAHTCGLTTAGEAWCWGGNGGGQLGDGTDEDRLEPARVETDLTFEQITAGNDHTCAVTSQNTVHCWGLNSSGQLGDGTTLARSTPVEVSGGLSVASIDAGTATTCVVTAEGAGYCWGRGLGNGSFRNQLEPVRVLEPWEGG